MMIGTDWTGSCKPYYYAITTAPQLFGLNVKCTILHDNKIYIRHFFFKLKTNEKLNELLICKHTRHHLHSRSLNNDGQKCHQ